MGAHDAYKHAVVHARPGCPSLSVRLGFHMKRRTVCCGNVWRVGPTGYPGQGLLLVGLRCVIAASQIVTCWFWGMFRKCVWSMLCMLPVFGDSRSECWSVGVALLGILRVLSCIPFRSLGGGIGEAYRQLNLNCLTPVFLGHRLFQKNTQICSLTVCQTRGRSIQLGLIITHVKQNMLVLRRHLAVGNGWARRA